MAFLALLAGACGGGASASGPTGPSGRGPEGGLQPRDTAAAAVAGEYRLEVPRLLYADRTRTRTLSASTFVLREGGTWGELSAVNFSEIASTPVVRTYGERGTFTHLRGAVTLTRVLAPTDVPLSTMGAPEITAVTVRGDTCEVQRGPDLRIRYRRHYPL